MSSYNDIAKEYEAYGKEATTDVVIGYGAVLELLGDIQGKKLLDYGCGTGKFSRIAKDAGAEVVGVDIADNELAIAATNNSDISFNRPENIAAQEGSFDAAVLNFVVTAIPSQEVIATIFKNIRASLKSGGRLVMMNSNYEKIGDKNFLTFSVGKVTQEIGAPLQVFLGADKALEIKDYFYPREFYFSKLSEAGFEVEKTLEPLALSDEYPWKDEKTHPPFLLISALAK